MNYIPSLWLQDSNSISVDIFDSITSHLVDVQKVPRLAYSMLTETCVPENRIEFWEKLIDVNADEEGPEETVWEEIHLRNFKCFIETNLRSFYFKISIRLLHLTIFYLKLITKILTVVIFVKTFPETIIHVFFVNVIMLHLFGMILLKLLKISMTFIFLFQTLKRCLEFSRIILLHIYFFVWNTIFMYVNLMRHETYIYWVHNLYQE